MTPNISGVKKLIILGKKNVIFLSKKLFKEKSIIPKKINNNPIGRNSKRLLLSGFKKLIFDIIYFSFIAIRLLYQFITNEIAKLILQ